MSDIHEKDILAFLDCAIMLAKQAGNSAKQYLGKTKTSHKSDNSPVTQADIDIQEKIISDIIKRFPEHGIIAEEDDIRQINQNQDTDLFWIIDPIDGTRNFARNIPIFCCSIALLYKGSPIIAAIYEPNINWLFTATSLHQSELNRQKIHVNDSSFSSRTVLAYSVDTCKPIPKKLTAIFNECVLRNFGSAALHLAMTATGMIDGVMNFSGKLWDIAAGALIISQAGGQIAPVNDSDESIWPIDTKNYNNEAIELCAGNDKIVKFIRKYK